MSKPPSVYIMLTPEQEESLKVHFAYVRSEAARNARGMLVAQVFDAATYPGGPARMRVGFIERDAATALIGAVKAGEPA